MDREESKKQLEKEFHWFLDNLPLLAQKYGGLFVVVKNMKVIGAYDAFTEAIHNTLKTEEIGTFLVRKCSIDPADYTNIINSEDWHEVKIPPMTRAEAEESFAVEPNMTIDALETKFD